MLLTKICTCCSDELPILMFHKMGRNKNGTQRYKAICKDCTSTQTKVARLIDPERFRATSKRWRKANPEKVREGINKCRAAKPDQYRTTAIEWERNNPDKVTAKGKRYRKKHPEVFATHAANRRAIKLQATPKWVEAELILSMYEESSQLTKDTGVQYNVDHIVPLNSSLVCGLHCIDNLQILTAYANGSKGNHSWPDMW